MPIRSRCYKEMQAKRGEGQEPLPVEQAIDRLREMAQVGVSRSYKNARDRKKFDQTVELVMHLGIDPKQADQMIRGSVSLPHGIGKTKKVIAFCEEDLAPEAQAAGAVEAGGDELIDRIQKGWLDFDVAVAHPKLMGKVGKLGRILGPSGKMPSPKSGTVTPNIAEAIKEYAAGKIEYRNDAGGNIHAIVGKMSFDTTRLTENIEFFVGHIRKARPATAKGQYIKRVCLSGSMTPSVSLAVD